jgi:hypothetical protein
MRLACNAVMHGQHTHPPCPQHDCCCDEIGPATDALALSALTQSGAESCLTPRAATKDSACILAAIATVSVSQ